MLLSLANIAGDLYADEAARLLGGLGKETFLEAALLEEGVESEIRRRILHEHE